MLAKLMWSDLELEISTSLSSSSPLYFSALRFHNLLLHCISASLLHLPGEGRSS